jgi:A/G-specific adenine glycosylase
LRDAKAIAETVGERLLDWYGAHARAMPWRVGPQQRAAGVRPDPYRVWLSEVMLQQTTVATVGSYFGRFTARWPSVEALAAAEDAEVMAEWAGLGYYARARNLLKCARAVAGAHAGRFPENREALQELPGIGPYTSAAIAAIAFDEPAAVLDGNVERVLARLFCIETPLPAAKPELMAIADALTPMQRPGDFAQAMMDLGATICTPRAPGCGICPLMELCEARPAGIQAEFPRKAPKPEKPTRHGIAYLARRSDGAWLLERRPDRGLLGGMLGWPGSDWSAAPMPAPPLAAEWRDIGAEVRHTFTHFHLRLALRVAEVPKAAEPERGRFLPVMRKAFDLARHAFPGCALADN